jgi:hypothetical protein
VYGARGTGRQGGHTKTVQSSPVQSSPVQSSPVQCVEELTERVGSWGEEPGGGEAGHLGQFPTPSLLRPLGGEGEGEGEGCGLGGGVT